MDAPPQRAGSIFAQTEILDAIEQTEETKCAVDSDGTLFKWDGSMHVLIPVAIALAPREMPHPARNRPTANILSIALFSYIGVLLRVGLTEIAKYGVAGSFPALFPEVVGTATMGFVVASRGVIDGRHHPLYVGLTTGLCGSITTFSAWNQEASELLVGAGPTSPRGAAYRVIGYISILVLGLGMPAVSLTFGSHVAYLWPLSDVRRAEAQLRADLAAKTAEQSGRSAEGEPVPVEPTNATRSETTTNIDAIADATANATAENTAADDEAAVSNSDKYSISGTEDVAIAVAFVAATGAVIGSTCATHRYDLMFDCALLRYWLSRFNAHSMTFPIGTFVANIVGSVLLAVFVVVPMATNCFSGSSTVNALFTGLQVGFCGCLTTMSTLENEVRTLGLRDAYVYALSSVVVAQVCIGAINGGYSSHNTVRICAR